MGHRLGGHWCGTNIAVSLPKEVYARWIQDHHQQLFCSEGAYAPIVLHNLLMQSLKSLNVPRGSQVKNLMDHAIPYCGVDVF